MSKLARPCSSFDCNPELAGIYSCTMGKSHARVQLQVEGGRAGVFGGSEASARGKLVNAGKPCRVPASDSGRWVTRRERPRPHCFSHFSVSTWATERRQHHLSGCRVQADPHAPALVCEFVTIERGLLLPCGDGMGGVRGKLLWCRCMHVSLCPAQPLAKTGIKLVCQAFAAHATRRFCLAPSTPLAGTARLLGDAFLLLPSLDVRNTTRRGRLSRHSPTLRLALFACHPALPASGSAPRGPYDVTYRRLKRRLTKSQANVTLQPAQARPRLRVLFLSRAPSHY